MSKHAPDCPCCLDGKWAGTCPLCGDQPVDDELAAAYRLLTGLDDDMNIEAAQAARFALGLPLASNVGTYDEDADEYRCTV